LPATCEGVGLFVDRPPVEVAETARSVGLKIVQLHGSEPPEDFLTLGDFSIVRAFRLGDKSAISAMNTYLERAASLGRPPDAVLVDGYVAGQAGGTGRSIALDLLDLLPPLPRLILGRVVRARPWMVDVASGVESSPGQKDPARVAAFVKAARGG
jgi:phosphoribosylanthranilate isomerase